MIEKSVNDAVDDDRYKAESRKKLGISAQSDYERAVSLYGDQELATLDARNRKLANTMAMIKSQAADPGLDPMMKQRAASVFSTVYDKYLEGVRQLAEGIQGRVLTQEVNYKQAPATGGGGGGNDPLKMLQRGAEATKYVNTIEGNDNKPKLNPHEQSEMNAEEADMVPLKELLHRYRNADDIPGVGGRNVVSRATRGAADFVAGPGAGSRALDSDEERANRIIVERAALAYRHKMTGAGGSAKEMEGIDQAFAGARTKRDLEEAVRVSELALSRRRGLAAGGRSNAGDAPERDASEEPAR
jgi:hypothetical protein